MIRLQAKATKKPLEIEKDFKKFLHKLVCFVFKLIKKSLSLSL